MATHWFLGVANETSELEDVATPSVASVESIAVVDDVPTSVVAKEVNEEPVIVADVPSAVVKEDEDEDPEEEEEELVDEEGDDKVVVEEEEELWLWYS